MNWTSTDGILAIDLNGNGMIDDGREVFGDNHLLWDGTIPEDGADWEKYIIKRGLGAASGDSGSSSGGESQQDIWRYNRKKLPTDLKPWLSMIQMGTM